MNRVNVSSLDKKYKTFEREIKEAALAALKILKKDKLFVEIYLVGSRRIRTLNRKFRNKDAVTNTLSFEEPSYFPHPESRLRPIGEIYLNPDYIKSKGENLTLLTVHGILHLLGLTHHKKSDRIRMEFLEKKILSNL